MSRARLVVLLSGSGTILQALLDAAADPTYPATVVAVGSDVATAQGLARAQDTGVTTFVLPTSSRPTRAEWDQALTDEVAVHEPDLVVLAGFMKLVGPVFQKQFDGRVINTHPALTPSFPGMHAARDAIDYAVRVTGCTIFLVDDGIDSGPIVAQVPVLVNNDDTVETLSERIKQQERALMVSTVAELVTRDHRVEGRKVVWS